MIDEKMRSTMDEYNRGSEGVDKAWDVMQHDVST